MGETGEQDKVSEGTQGQGAIRAFMAKERVWILRV